MGHREPAFTYHLHRAHSHRSATRGRLSERERFAVDWGWRTVQPEQTAPTAKSSEHHSSPTAPTGGRERAQAVEQAVEAQKQASVCTHAASEHKSCSQAQAAPSQRMA